jgi:hypothetical protein
MPDAKRDEAAARHDLDHMGWESHHIGLAHSPGDWGCR